ncbi:MAG TPA: hypothetical protein VFT42_00270 [Solirubrobacteraceae bacterium]|nr:hypothetical protein [Solirubrobacteraceae bacterium]
MAAAPNARRAWPLTVRAPVQFDATLARISFTVPPGTRRPGLRIATAGPTGFDQVTIGRAARQPRHRLLGFVLVVNRRPKGSLAPDLLDVRLSAHLGHALPKPRLLAAVNVYANPGHAPRALCSTPPASPAAVVRAFDAACGRPM